MSARNTRLRRVFIVSATLAACGACSTGTQVKGVHKAPVPQHEIDSRAEARAQRGTSASTDGQDKALPPGMQRAMTSYKVALRNAARRDREMEGLIRRYLGLTREVFQAFRRNRPTAGGGQSSYNPVPAWRFQAQQSFEYRLLAARAAMVTQHLRDIAATQQLDLDALMQSKGNGRGERIALYARIFVCIRTDAMARADHGKRYLKNGWSQPPQIARDLRAKLYNSELSMMRRSITCTSLTAMRRPRAIGMR